MGTSKTTTREANWDLLRSLAMLFVVIVHTAGYLGPIGGFETATPVAKAALICDPVFFTMSGFFALRPQKRSLKNYYLNKVSTILLPLMVYAIILYFYNTGFYNMSIGLFFGFFADLLAGRWWFIPALVPCLVAAPFLFKGLEALSDRQIAILTIILASLFLSGGIFMTLEWLFAAIGIETLANFSELMLLIVPPSIMTSYPAYYLFFLLGGMFRRLTPHIGKKMGTGLILCGLVFWLVDTTWSTIGIPKADPSFFWIFTAFGVMILFQRIQIKSPTTKTAIYWVGKRSYSIYLLQRTTIAISAGLFYDQALFGTVADMAAPFRIFIWALMVMGAYLLALAIASLVDSLVLSNLQKWFSKALIKPEPKLAGSAKPNQCPGTQAPDSST